jgi:hypothetical protein
MEPPLPTSIRNAVASGEFSRALLLWEEYAATLADMARRGILTEALLREASQLVEWTRTAALIARSQGFEDLAQRRATCRVARAYCGIPAGQP